MVKIKVAFIGSCHSACGIASAAGEPKRQMSCGLTRVKTLASLWGKSVSWEIPLFLLTQLHLTTSLLSIYTLPLHLSGIPNYGEHNLSPVRGSFCAFDQPSTRPAPPLAILRASLHRSVHLHLGNCIFFHVRRCCACCPRVIFYFILFFIFFF